MQTFMAVCLAIIALELGVACAAFVLMALGLREAARAIEMLAYRVDEEVEQVGSAMRSGWVKSLQTLAGVVSGVWFNRKRDDE
jgi:hypothetical protein